MKSRLESHFQLLLRSLKISFKREYKFHPTRKWRADFYLPEKNVIVEIEGGIWSGKSRHTTGSGYAKDSEKYNQVSILGFYLLRYTDMKSMRQFENDWRAIQ